MGAAGDGSVLLLELSAADDLPGFRRAVEDGINVDAAAPWYGRWGRRTGFELRTPLMVAAAYGSTAVMGYLLATGAVDVNRACGSDGATALHCAAAGGSPSAAMDNEYNLSAEMLSPWMEPMYAEQEQMVA